MYICWETDILQPRFDGKVAVVTGGARSPW